ncbi:MAG: hypothetical protein FH761_08640 [Firmicutes bacterium]|nr:hypothetical protein [Bacillota bacterium]
MIFDWGIHGPRKRLFNNILKNLEDIEFEYIPIIITCDEKENITRMKMDERSKLRIGRAMEIRNLYNDLSHYTIDTTDMSPDEVVDDIVKYLKLV